MSRLLFVNLPVKDLSASTEFFRALGFDFDPSFTNEECACMVISDQAYVMLLTQARFSDFAVKPLADPATSTQSLLCVSAESRDGVDELADAAVAAGAALAGEPEDHGYMYGRGFHDLDGHGWSVMWMSPEAIAAPPEMAETA